MCSVLVYWSYLLFETHSCCVFFFFKQKTSYEMRISDCSSDVCSSDLVPTLAGAVLRVVNGLLVDRIGPKRSGAISQVIVIAGLFIAWLAGVSSFAGTLALGKAAQDRKSTRLNSSH